MGVYRVDGGRGVTSGAGVPSQPSASRPATFAQAVQNARTATDKAFTSKDPELLKLAQASWGIVQEWEANDYRLAAASSDPNTAIAALDVKYGGLVQDNGAQKKIFDGITATAKKTVEDESPAERKFQLDLYAKKGKVADTYDGLQNVGPDDRNTAFTAYTTAVKDLVNFQLQHELSKLPAGPSGSHTLAQWQQAADNIKALPGTSPQSAKLIDTMAKVNGYSDQIQNNRASLKLTPGEEELANKDPVMLAFVKAAGLIVDDPKLSPEMKQLAQKDPILFVMLSLGGADISTSATPVVKDSLLVGQMQNGQYLHIVANGKAIVDPTVLTQLVQIYDGFDDETRTTELAKALVPALNPEKNDTLQSLMLASDAARTEYGTKQMKALTSSANPDGKAILAFTTTQLNGYFDSGARKAFWEASGKPFFTQDYFRKQFDQLLKKPDPTSTDRKDILELQSTETNADKIGRYMQDVLKDAPQEIADVLLDTVKSSYRADWEHSNQFDSSGLTSRYEEFYKALTMAVELSPGRAGEITNWLMDRSAPQGVILTILWDPQLRRFEGLKDTITEGYGPTLSLSLLEAVKKSRDHQNMEFDLELRFNQGYEKVQDKYARKVNKQNYDEIMKDVDKYLQPFFQTFLGDKNIGNPVSIKNETQIHNMIGKVLNLAPTNTEAAKKLDYTQEWYTPDTADWNKIILVTKMINDQVAELRKEHGNRAYTINALPGKYISERDGTQSRALFVINLEGVNADEWIDPQAALNAVALNGGQEVKWDDLHGKWHHDDFYHFQVDNPDDDDGFLYLPTNFRLGDSDNDGKISSADYHQEAAAITTGEERAQSYAMTGLAVVGVVGLFIPGANVLVATAMISAGVLGAGIALNELWKLKQTGTGNIGLSDPEARMHWMNFAGSALAFGRIGLLSSLSPASKTLVLTRQGTAAFMGAGSTYIGVNLMATQALHISQTWDDPTVSGWDKFVSVTGLASGAMMIGLSGMQVKPWKGTSNPVKDYGGTRVASARQTGAYAFKQWLAAKSPSGGLVAQLWKTSNAKFQAKIGQPAYQKWVDAGRPAEKWWTDAVSSFRTKIDTEAQVLAGPGNPVTAAHTTQAELSFADPIGVKAFELWGADNKPKGVTSTMWSRAQKTFNRETSWSAYQLWRGEQGFIKQIGNDAYAAHLASVAAKNKPAPWWTEAITGFQAKIDAKAQALAGPGNTPTATQMATAEASFARPIGIEAYRLWNTKYGNQRAPITQINGKPAKPEYTYKGWLKAGSPTRLTTKSDDVVVWSDTQRLLRTGSLTTKPVNLGPVHIGPKTIGPMRLWRDPHVLKQSPTDVTIWSGAERIFKIRIGKSNYNQWAGPTLNKTVGTEDTYFNAANTHYTNEIAAKAYDYFENPILLGERWTPRVDRGATGEFWTKNRTEFETQIKSAAGDWVSDGMPVNLRHWKEAVADMHSDIHARAYDLWQVALKTNPAATKAQFIPEAQKYFSNDIAQNAFTRWTGTHSPSAKYASQWKLANDKMDESKGAPAYDLWAKAGLPDGRRNAPWVAARRDVVSSGYSLRRTGKWFQDLWQQSRIRAGDRGGAFSKVGWKQGWSQMVSTAKYTGKWYARLYVGFNAVGVLGWLTTNYWVKEHRTTGDITNAPVELQMLLDNKNYVDENYDQWSFIPIQADGHLMAFVTPDGNVEYFRRIPGDLYEKLKSGQKTGGAEPWVLDTRTNQQANTQVFANGKRLYVYETIKLDESGTFPFSETDLLKNNAALLPDAIKEQIGVRAYQLWVKAGRPQGTAGATQWTQAETDFRTQTGTLAYDAWVTGKKLTTGDNVYWDQGVKAFQQQIETEAETLWKADTDPNKSANFKVAKYLDPAKKKYGADIATNVYVRWNQGGRNAKTLGVAQWTGNAGAYDAWVTGKKLTTGDNVYWDQGVKAFQQQIETEAETLWKADTDPNKSANFKVAKYLDPAEKKYGADIATNVYVRWNQGGRSAKTVGVAQWNAGEPAAFQDKLSLPAFTAWVDAKKPTEGDNAVWAGAITEWDKAGKPIMQQVEIRAPFRIEGNSDVPKPHTTKTSDYGRRDRFNWGIGPIEGWRIHANLELLGNYRYNTPTTTTFRIGGPSPTQGWSWDIRQQDTTMWSRFNLSVGTIEYNGAQVYDLTDDSRNGWTVMNSRLYTDIGNRNRIRFDGTGKYLRFRETGFVEIGVGADFFKVTTADGTFNVNGYYELQLYAPDFRSQVNLTSNIDKQYTRGFEQFPLLGIDPAFQISWSSNKGLRLADIPGLSSDNS